MADFAPVFDHLKQLLASYSPQMVVQHDEPGNYYLDTPLTGPNQKPLFFGAVQTRKNYVSYHLFPVYMYPDLLDEVSENLKKRMQGKACFNFRTVDDPLLDELAALTRRGYERMQSEVGL